MVVIEEQFNEAISKGHSQSPWRKTLFRTPLYIWRFGLRFLLPPSFACITTRGRKSGQPRYTMVEHYEIDGDFYIFSGWQANSHWVRNLLTDPDITIQPAHNKPTFGFADRVDDDADLRHIFEAMQHRPMWKLWLKRLDIEPTIASFLGNKDHLYIFQITADEKIKLPLLPADLRWVTAAILGGFGLLIRVRFRRRQAASNHRIRHPVRASGRHGRRTK
jgi:deazaflavin-dependent oxidoreductase (nitroreductase family)